MISKFILAALFFLLALSGCGGDGKNSKDGVNGSNPYPGVPQGSGGGTLNANKNFAFLTETFPSAVISPAPWAGFWWPYSNDGIATAASKYDAVHSAGATSWERGHHGNGLGDVADWWGHCNGWAAAAMLTPEPRESRSVSGQAFGIADRKALLSEIYMEVTGDFLGTRVDDPNDRSSAAFRDITPAQFFLMVTNIMGSQHRAFVMDRFTGNEVWNQPVVAYSIAPVRPEDYIGPDPQFPNVHRVNVTTTIYWVSDNVSPNVTTPAFDPSNPASVFESRTLRYEIWLDAAPQFDASGHMTSSGDVILTSSGVGGQWKNGDLSLVNSYPDYMWIPTGPARASGFKNPNLDDNWVLQNM